MTCEAFSAQGQVRLVLVDALASWSRLQETEKLKQSNVKLALHDLLEL